MFEKHSRIRTNIYMTSYHRGTSRHRCTETCRTCSLFRTGNTCKWFPDNCRKLLRQSSAIGTRPTPTTPPTDHSPISPSARPWPTGQPRQTSSSTPSRMLRGTSPCLPMVVVVVVDAAHPPTRRTTVAKRPSDELLRRTGRVDGGVFVCVPACVRVCVWALWEPRIRTNIQ